MRLAGGYTPYESEHELPLARGLQLRTIGLMMRDVAMVAGGTNRGEGQLEDILQGHELPAIVTA